MAAGATGKAEQGDPKSRVGREEVVEDEVARLFEGIKSFFEDGSVEGADEEWSPLHQPKS
jgi:hypothetical protein